MDKFDVNFRRFMAKNFKSVYKNFLSTVVYNDKEMVEAMFESEGVEESFNEIVYSIFKGEVCDFSKYEELTGDKYLSAYLRIFTYYIKETYDTDLVENGKYAPGKVLLDENGNKYNSTESKYLSRLSYICNRNFNIMYPDIKNGNYWWEADSPTTLRNAIVASGMVITNSKLQFLAKKYLNREINVQKELVEGSELPINLIRELDYNLKKRNHATCYAWYEKTEEGTKLKTSDKKPKDGKYYFVMYQDDMDFIYGHGVSSRNDEMLK